MASRGSIHLIMRAKSRVVPTVISPILWMRVESDASLIIRTVKTSWQGVPSGNGTMSLIVTETVTRPTGNFEAPLFPAIVPPEWDNHFEALAWNGVGNGMTMPETLPTEDLATFHGPGHSSDVVAIDYLAAERNRVGPISILFCVKNANAGGRCSLRVSGQLF